MGATFFVLLLIFITCISIILIALGISKKKKLKYNPILIAGIVLICIPVLSIVLTVLNNYSISQYEKSIEAAVNKRDINRVSEF